MRRFITISLILMLLTSGLVACPQKPPPLLTPEITLEKVEISAYFHNPAVPIRDITKHPAAYAPLVLGFIFNIKNPNDFVVKLERFIFTIEFEAVGAPGEFFAVHTPMIYEHLYIPAKMSNPLRITAVLDSHFVVSNLAVTSGVRLMELQLSPKSLMEKWWIEIPDFTFKIRLADTTAEFSSDYGRVITTFTGIFPP